MFVFCSIHTIEAAETTSVFGMTEETKHSYAGQKTVMITDETDLNFSDSFSQLTAVTKLIIGEGIETLPYYIFYKYPNVEMIELPDSLVNIGEAFSHQYTSYLDDYFKQYFSNTLSKCKSIRIPETNAYYTVMDDVLYTRDMSRLLYYPSMKVDVSFEIPESVIYIDSEAFYSNIYLKEFTIGAMVETLPTGKDLKNRNLPNLSAYRVNAYNSFYSEIDGVLFNAEKTVLVSYPQGRVTSQYLVPKTVKDIKSYAFYNASIESVVLPDAFNPENGNISAMFEDSDIKNIHIHNNSRYESVDGVIYNKKKTTLIYWPLAKNVSYLKFPSSLKQLNFNDIPCILQVKTITIPRDTSSIYNASKNALETISIEPGNKTFVLYSGLLYKKDYSELVLIPTQTAKTSITIPENFKYCTMGEYSPQIKNIKTITFNGNCDNFCFGLFENLENIMLSKGNSQLKVKDGCLYSKDMTTLIWYPQNKKNTSYTVPSTVTKFGQDVLKSQKHVETIILPKNLIITEDTLGFSFSDCKQLKEIEVASGNKYIVSKDGVLFNKKMTALLCYPPAKTAKSYTLPDGVETVNNRGYNVHLETLILGKRLKTINRSFDLKLDYFSGFSALKSIHVDENINGYYSRDGVLYKRDNKSGNSTLFIYPMGEKSTSIIIEKDITDVLCLNALNEQKYLETIISNQPRYCTDGKKLYDVTEEYYKYSMYE